MVSILVVEGHIPNMYPLPHPSVREGRVAPVALPTVHHRDAYTPPVSHPRP